MGWHDCNDEDSSINPGASELCNGIDDDCSGVSDDNIEIFSYYLDSDEDGYGDISIKIDTCLMTAPEGYVSDTTDCDDTNIEINPGQNDIPNNGIDEDCDGQDFTSGTKENNLNNLISLYPIPVENKLVIEYEYSGKMNAQIINLEGKALFNQAIYFSSNQSTIDFSTFPKGIYILKMYDDNRENFFLGKVVK